jgi:predicted GTPase
VIFLVDAREGLSHEDATYRRMAPPPDVPVYLAANKVEGMNVPSLVGEFYELGMVGTVFGCRPGRVRVCGR